MSQGSTEDGIIICSENISNDYRIAAEEIVSHAKKLGVNFESERYLLPVVLKGLVHPLPSDWIPCYDKRQEEFFYHNLKSGISQWEHPVDEHYRNVISVIRNKCNGNLEDYLNSTENSEMLPLRQNRKPQLVPIKQLLKYKDEEKVTADEKNFKSDFQSSLKSKSDPFHSYKKSVSFSPNKSFLENEFLYHHSEFETEADKITSSKNAWDSNVTDALRNSDNFLNSHERSESSSNEDGKAELTPPLSKNLQRKISSLKQTFNQNKTNIESQSSNNFKRLQINLRHPDSLLFSDSNHDDTIKNLLSGSASSEFVSEEEESPHNVMTNVTESGIDVNTVTDIQKLKARSKFNNQNSDVNEQTARFVKTSLASIVADLEQNLNVKFEAKIAEEIAKLKKFYRDKLESNFNKTLSTEKLHNYELAVKETEQRFQIFKREVENEMNKNRKELDELKNIHMEINRLNTELKSSHNKYEWDTSLEDLKKQLENIHEERLNNVERSLIKKIENLEMTSKIEQEQFKNEKEKLLTEYRELFVNEHKKNVEEVWQENLQNIVQNCLTDFVTKRMKNDDPIFQNLEKVIYKVLLEKQGNEKINNVERKAVAMQTEKEEFFSLKEQLDEISNTVKRVVEEMKYIRGMTNEEIIPVERGDEIISEKKGKGNNRAIHGQTPLKVKICKTDFFPFNEICADIDKELDHYRKKYLSNSKWFESE